MSVDGSYANGHVTDRECSFCEYAFVGRYAHVTTESELDDDDSDTTITWENMRANYCTDPVIDWDSIGATDDFLPENAVDRGPIDWMSVDDSVRYGNCDGFVPWKGGGVAVYVPWLRRCVLDHLILLFTTTLKNVLGLLMIYMRKLCALSPVNTVPRSVSGPFFGCPSLMRHSSLLGTNRRWLGMFNCLGDIYPRDSFLRCSVSTPNWCLIAPLSIVVT